MATAGFIQLQSVLAQASRLSAADQLSFVHGANLAFEGRVPNDELLALRDAARSLLRRIWGRSARPDASALWTRWTDGDEETGIGLLLATPHGRLVLLPGGFEADGLTFDRAVADPITLGGLGALCPEHADLFPPSPVRDEKTPLSDAAGNEAGWARLLCGGSEGSFGDADSRLSGVTSLGDGLNQEDGLYLARHRTRDGRSVRVLAGADGMGGAPLGEEASKAALLGVHAGVVRALEENRLSLAGDLFEDARRGLIQRIEDMQTLRGRAFRHGNAPNAVIAIAVVIDDLATIATAGDFLVTYGSPGPDGGFVTRGASEVDAYSDHGVFSSLLNGALRLYRVRMGPGGRICLGSDGLVGCLMPGFKRRFSTYLRHEGNSPHPEQRLLRNLNLLLRRAPPDRTAQALFEASMGWDETPGLGPVGCELDNKTALAAGSEEGSHPPFEAPGHYADLNPVLPADQYVYDTQPYHLRMPADLPALHVGRGLHPSGLPMMVLPDERLEPLHARIAREDGNRFFVEKLVGRGRIVLFDRDDHKIAAILRKGGRHPVRPGDLIRLTPRTFLRFGEG
jgi:hypothetical protein